MSGINSVASKKVGGNKFLEKYDEFNKKFNFNYYKNSFQIQIIASILLDLS